MQMKLENAINTLKIRKARVTFRSQDIITLPRAQEGINSRCSDPSLCQPINKKLSARPIGSSYYTLRSKNKARFRYEVSKAYEVVTLVAAR